MLERRFVAGLKHACDFLVIPSVCRTRGSTGCCPGSDVWVLVCSGVLLWVVLVFV